MNNAAHELGPAPAEQGHRVPAAPLPVTAKRPVVNELPATAGQEAGNGGIEGVAGPVRTIHPPHLGPAPKAALARDLPPPVQPSAAPVTQCVALAIGFLESAREAMKVVAPVCELVELATVPEAVAALGSRRFQAIFIDALAPGLSPQDLDTLRMAAPRTPKAVIGPPAAALQIGNLSEAADFRFLSTALPPAAFTTIAKRVLFPRNFDRVSFAHLDHKVEASVDGRAFEHSLLDVSNRGLSFAVDLGSRLEGLVAGAALKGLTIRAADGRILWGPTDGTIRHCRVEDTELGFLLKVGVSIESALPTRSPHARVATEPQAILASFRKAVRSKAPFVITFPDSDEGTQYDEAELLFEPDAILRLVAPAHEGLRVHDVVRLSVSHNGQSYTGLTSVVDLRDGVRLGIPRSVRVHHRRSSNRHQPTAARPYGVRLSSALTGSIEQLPAFDLNAAGVSVIIDRERDLLPPGLRLDGVEILLPEGGVIRAGGVVRALSPLPRRLGETGASPARCGIELTGLTDDARHELRESLLADGFPFTEFPTEADFDEIWSLLPKAGFKFHLFSDNSPESISTVRNGLGRIFGPARDVGFSLIFRSEGAIHGHTSGIKIYSGTYLGTHLAAQQSATTSGERVSRALVLAILEQFENRPDVEFMKLLWKREQRWADHMFGWVGRSLPEPELGVFSDVWPMLRKNADPLPVVAGALDVTPAQAADLAAIERYFWSTVGLLRLRSEDLTARAMSLKQIGADYAGAGFFRKRLARVVRVNGVLAGFSLLERSTPGIQLAEFLNSFDVYPLPGLEPGLEKLVRGSLVADASAFYTSEGLPHSIALSHTSDTAHYADAGFKPMAALRSLTVHRTGLRACSDLLDLLFMRRHELINRW